MRTNAFFLTLVLTAAGVQAGTESMQMKAYLAMKQDSDLYVGEGTADLKDFAGDQAKALEAARQRARGSLAEAVQVHVKSDTAENLKSENGKLSEKIESQTQSHTDLVLENVKFLELPGLPAAGQVTVLASLSKEDYRRQLAGKSIPVYRPQFGVAAGLEILSLSSIANLVDRSAYFNSSGASSGPPYPSNPVKPGQPGPMTGFGLALTWPFMVLQAEYFQQNIQLWNDFRDSATSTPDIYNTDSFAASLILIEAGYDWTPWASRVQPYLPLRLKAGFLSMHNPTWGDEANYSDLLFGASAGLGVRYWLNGEFSVEAALSWNLALNAQALQGDSKNVADDRLLHFTPMETAPALDLGGGQLHVGVKWSGF